MLTDSFRPLTAVLGRFGIVGVVCTLTAYAIFVIAAGFMHYVLANVLGWLAATGLSFALNRRFTFGISDVEHIRRDAVLFALGSLGQLTVASASYWLLIGVLGLPPFVAFPIVLGLTVPPMFLFLKAIAFRRRRKADITPARSS
jgi:putative flippase GtrA